MDRGGRGLKTGRYVPASLMDDPYVCHIARVRSTVFLLYLLPVSVKAPSVKSRLNGSRYRSA